MKQKPCTVMVVQHTMTMSWGLWAERDPAGQLPDRRTLLIMENSKFLVGENDTFSPKIQYLVIFEILI